MKNRKTPTAENPSSVSQGAVTQNQKKDPRLASPFGVRGPKRQLAAIIANAQENLNADSAETETATPNNAPETAKTGVDETQ